MSLTIELGRDPILDMDPWRGGIHAFVDCAAFTPASEMSFLQLHAI